MGASARRGKCKEGRRTEKLCANHPRHPILLDLGTIRIASSAINPPVSLVDIGHVVIRAASAFARSVWDIGEHDITEGSVHVHEKEESQDEHHE
jgi:hypothetical protein